MATKPCPNCGAPKHPLKACSECGLSILRQEWMERRAKSFCQETQDSEFQLDNDALLASAREINSQEISNNSKSSASLNTTEPIIRTPHSKQSTTREQRSVAKKLSKKTKPKIQSNQQQRTATQTEHYCWKCPVCHAIFLSKQTKIQHLHVHGIKAIARATAEQISSSNKKTIAIEVSKEGFKKSVSQVARAKVQNVLSIDSPNISGACRLCGKNKPMIGEDICYHCQSE